MKSELRSAGFLLAENVAGIPTAFTATWGQGKPVIGIMGEYDALPGLSQEDVPERRPRVAGARSPCDALEGEPSSGIEGHAFLLQQQPLRDLVTRAGAPAHHAFRVHHAMPGKGRAGSQGVERVADLCRRRFVELAAGRGHQLREILGTVRNLDSDEGLRPVRRELDLWPLVQRLCLDLRPVTDAAHIRLANAVPRHLTAHADAGLLARALQNLVGNAVKFAPGGEIEIGARETGGGVECWVRDNGAGIPPERLGRIFDKRETDPDPARAGSGFGLAILKQIVEVHGGAVSVESAPGQGATFRFTIPVPPRA